MAERQLPKLNVAGSIPVSRSNKISSFTYTVFNLCSEHTNNLLNSRKLHVVYLRMNGYWDRLYA